MTLEAIVRAYPVLLALGCLGRVLLSALGLRAIAKLPRLKECPTPATPHWPSVSVLIPARNEEATLERALASKLRLDYANLEVVAVDDRSSDATGAMLDRIAAGDPRVRALHIRELPAGWLGKVYALHVAVKQSRGEWLLLTDADVELAPDTLLRALAHVEHAGLDFLTAVPTLRPVSLAVDALMSDLLRTLLPLLQPDWISDPAKPFAAGGGAFMLVRRTAYERSRGLEDLKLEIVDDMALAQQMKWSGARCGVVNGAELVQLTFYRSLSDAAVGAEKAFGSVARYSISRLLLTAGIMLLLGTAPLLALVGPGPGWLVAVGALTAFVDVGSTAFMARACGMPMRSAALVPAGSVLMTLLLLRSGWLALYRGGIRWRDTFYQTEALRAGMRYRFPWG